MDEVVRRPLLGEVRRDGVDQRLEVRDAALVPARHPESMREAVLRERDGEISTSTIRVLSYKMAQRLHGFYTYILNMY